MIDDLTRQRLARLATAARDGDRVALEELLRLAYPLIHGVCARLIGTQGDVEDTAQVALTKIAQGMSNYRGDAQVTTWMHRIATNCALDELRRARRRATPAPTVDDLDGAPDDNLTTVEFSVDVTRALDALSVEFRTAVVLRDVADLDYDEIAEIVDCPIGTVKSRIARGRAQLAEMLAPGNPARTADVERGGDD